jgi:hypothetical protein
VSLTGVLGGTMLGRARNRARQERVHRAFADFRQELSAWVERRQASDESWQYQTQVESLTARLEQAASAIGQPLSSMDLGRPSTDFYDDCRLYELRLNWLQRLWRFYRDRFDQRDDERLGPVLRAADEVVWSCHRSVLSAPDRPAPLPFIEFKYSPEVFPSELIPAELTDVDSDFLREQLQHLPIPLLRLPASCVDEPWWLIHIGHEVGHHIQFALVEEYKLVEDFRAYLERILEEHGTPEDAESWGRWAKELFADVFAVHAMGAPAVSAMVEMELQRDMTADRTRYGYPPAVVRLELMAQLATALGLKGREALGELELAALAKGHPPVEEALKRVPHVVPAMIGPLPRIGQRLAELFGDPGAIADSELERWSGKLRTQERPAVTRHLRSARQLTGGALLAWLTWSEEHAQSREEGQEVSEEELLEHGKELGQRVIQAIRDGAPRGTRAAAAPSGDEDASEALARQILSMGRDQLESFRGR